MSHNAWSRYYSKAPHALWRVLSRSTNPERGECRWSFLFGKLHMKCKPPLGREFLNALFEYRDGCLYWKVDWARKKTKGNPVTGKDKNGYLIAQINRKQYFVHRIIFEMHHGYLPEMVDHHDRDVTNNLIDNLRAANNAKNQCNKLASTKNKCGIKGVCWVEKEGKWKAGIKVNQKSIHLGYFDDSASAGLAYQTAAIKYQGEFARVAA